jgi:hypothetical protein
MKKIKIALAIITLTAELIFSGCQTQTRKIEYAIANGLEFNHNSKTGLKEVSEELKKAVNAQDWMMFKKASEFKIRDNDIRIAELKVKMQRRGKQPDPVYKKKLNNLENVNLEMKKKLEVYVGNKNEWNSYKREFTYDLDKLGRTLTNLMVENEVNSKNPGDL